MINYIDHPDPLEKPLVIVSLDVNSHMMWITVGFTVFIGDVDEGAIPMLYSYEQ